MKKLTDFRVCLTAFLLFVCLVSCGTANESQTADNNARPDSVSTTVQKSSEGDDALPEKTPNTDISEVADDTAPETVTTIDEKQIDEWVSTNDMLSTAFVVVNNNEPWFTEEDKQSTESYEFYGDLDSLGRCTACWANVGKDLMPLEERGEIGNVKPTGWHTVKYDIVSGKYLYNRCHLIGYQLTAENANEKNLITGTRWLNIEGMLPFEDMVADYVKETDNHVLYRVTPIFSGDDLVARGVEMEGWSVEDNGEGICFNVFCFNTQPHIGIDYATGDSWLVTDSNENETESTAESTTEKPANYESQTWVVNTNTMKYHYADCRYAKSMSEKNKDVLIGEREWLEEQGYSPCSYCVGD